MSALVQHNNSPHYPQSTIMNSSDSSIRQRPTHNSSKKLLPNEVQCLYDILGQNRVVKRNKNLVLWKIFCSYLYYTLATAVAQILSGHNGAWSKKACGIFCFVKDYDNRSYCFRLYDLKVSFFLSVKFHFIISTKVKKINL
jgi:hypothetical protein